MNPRTFELTPPAPTRIQSRPEAERRLKVHSSADERSFYGPVWLVMG